MLNIHARSQTVIDVIEGRVASQSAGRNGEALRNLGQDQRKLNPRTQLLITRKLDFRASGVTTKVAHFEMKVFF